MLCGLNGNRKIDVGCVAARQLDLHTHICSIVRSLETMPLAFFLGNESDHFSFKDACDADKGLYTKEDIDWSCEETGSSTHTYLE
jgi:hypothetical protein